MKFVVSVIFSLAALSASAANPPEYPTQAEMEEIQAKAKSIAIAHALRNMKSLATHTRQEGFELTEEQRTAAYETFFGVAEEFANRSLAEEFFQGRHKPVARPIVILINTPADGGNAAFLSSIADILGHEYVYFNMSKSNPPQTRLRQEISEGRTMILDHFANVFSPPVNKTHFLSGIMQNVFTEAVILALNDGSHPIPAEEMSSVTYSTALHQSACSDLNSPGLPQPTFIPDTKWLN